MREKTALDVEVTSWQTSWNEDLWYNRRKTL